MGPRREVASLSVATFSMRLATVTLQSVGPAYMALELRLPMGQVALAVVLLWTLSALGSAAGVAAGRPRLTGSVGLALLAAGSATIFAFPRLAAAGIALSGLGAGMSGLVLAPALHLMSSPGKPFEGVGSYAMALSAGILASMALATALTSVGAPLAYAFLASALLSGASAAAVLAMPAPRLSARLPSVSEALRIASRLRFARAFLVNLAYSLAFPMVLSYWAIYSARVLGMPGYVGFAALLAMFLLSAAIRVALARSAARPDSLLAVGVLGFLSSAALMLAGGWLSVAGLVLFGVPHGLIYPLTLYEAMESEKGREVEANFLFSASSGGGEVLSALVSGVIVRYLGVADVMWPLLPLSLAAVASALAVKGQGCIGPYCDDGQVGA